MNKEEINTLIDNYEKEKKRLRKEQKQKIKDIKLSIEMEYDKKIVELWNKTRKILNSDEEYGIKYGVV